MISFPTYKIATGIADLATRKTIFPNIILGLVSQTNRKKRGRFPNALTRSLQVNGTFPVVAFALIYPPKVFFFRYFHFHETKLQTQNIAMPSHSLSTGLPQTQRPPLSK